MGEITKLTCSIQDSGLQRDWLSVSPPKVRTHLTNEKGTYALDSLCCVAGIVAFGIQFPHRRRHDSKQRAKPTGWESDGQMASQNSTNRSL